jgi:SagB-type dehydrogenase family enzyme
MLPLNDPAQLPLLYHLNSEPWLNYEAYANPANHPRYVARAWPGDGVSLPSTETSAIGQLLQTRGSCRAYSSAALTLGDLASVLDAAYGVAALVQAPTGLQALARVVPSAGGLYPLELYVASRSVESLHPGLHRYNVLYHTLEPLRSGPVFDEILSAVLTRDFVADASVLLIWTVVFERVLGKYGPRGYRYALLEAGHSAQNACLMAGERRLGSLCLGGFRDAQLNHTLGVDVRTEAAVYCMAVGHPATSDPNNANSPSVARPATIDA